jgi:hypothetical protein
MLKAALFSNAMYNICPIRGIKTFWIVGQAARQFMLRRDAKMNLDALVDDYDSFLCSARTKAFRVSPITTNDDLAMRQVID